MAFCLHCYAMGITEINEFIFLGTFLVGQSPHVFFGIMTGSALLAAEKSSCRSTTSKSACSSQVRADTRCRIADRPSA